jgi:methionine-rich copper-binding protein CopC
MATAVLASLLALPAYAHSELMGSSPEDGEQLYALPDELTLEFNENIAEIGIEITVTDSAGADATDGPPEVDGPVVSQPLGGGATGAYTVVWRVVSADGHPISGELTFEVLPTTEGDTVSPSEESTEPATTDGTTEPESTEAPSDTTTTEDAAAGEAASDAEDSSGPAFPWIAVAALVVIVGVVVLLVRRRQAR